MKTIIALFLLRFICMHSDNYYLLNAQAYDGAIGTMYAAEDGNYWADYDHHHGSVVLVMNTHGTDFIYDDEIFAVIDR